ncbi:lytic transglycosylase [Legionella parisiensis]|uniref:Membrane-bound lytic murein transglycosylase D n=1 Tax=Legionella parisiensis TaxID=45071 RepID=A0A1E5JLK5_9GAMM|nr:LysM peptidoglycan-binding domain-containing protein [Legionella parisiensis]KTD41591.1 membrane-bound lytic murein transglycosylase D [Legionella parisiensis]OEH45394.1 Membrane-bound lytic murein transglycosylase D [Legionella parisiensis]STX76091.1 membrane-bound lytic murein transglycosylase D [Legionella parisiensis]
MKFKFFKIKAFLFCLLIFFGITNATSAYTADAWEVLRAQFSLNHETSRAEVQEQIRWFIAHPGFLNKVCHQSEPYLYHIIAEVKKRNLPGELALLPMIESAFDPFAYSVAGAAGLWQLMPQTGAGLGLKQDWWFDARRSISSSTDAALNYLLYLNKFFNGNWVLAIAAYDAGEGTIDRAIKATGGRARSFWDLTVPRETQTYVPRLLALAEIIKSPSQYNLALPEIAYLPYFVEVNIGSPIDLNHAAKMAGISYKELIKLNPGFNRWTTAPDKPIKLLIPAEKVHQFNLNLANLPAEKRVSWEKHIVQPGDNLDNIAVRYHTTVNLIKQLNQLTTNRVEPNQFLLIPSTRNAPAVVKKEPSVPVIPLEHQIAVPQYHRVIHIVQENETFQTLIKTYGVSTADIQIWNKLARNQPLKYGQQLVIWKKVHQPIQYIVKKGDSLSSIARQHKTQIEHIIALNPGLKRNDPLYSGQKIFVG